MKKIFSMILCIVLLLSCFLCGCGYQYADLNLRGSYNKDLKGTTLNVYNWGEYIPEGLDGSMHLIKEFEKVTGIKVNYSTYVSNETMYSQLKNGGVSYDIIIPSDYMISRLVKEDLIQKIDVSSLSNYDLIDSKYKGLYFDEKEEYSIPYSVGMVGIIYNKKQAPNIEHSWNVLWDEKYKDMALNFDNPRDAFMTAQMLLGQDVNSTNKADWDAAADKLKSGKSNLQGYVMDDIYAKMETGEATVAPYYAGDYLTMLENNPDLDFFYPEEGTNIFVDSICIPKNAKNIEAAMMFINFILEPDISLAIAECIGYASPNTSVINNKDYYYYQNKVLYPDEEDMPKVQYYYDIDESIRSYYEKLWSDIKLY
ncbi:MAG: spermidine/putrescine ABC transporter substrate-binding protein [Clostridia bacterium]|nr:spermidine/putrescine ABC transporter substrate-binding protein [Clostridia bacterium]